MSYPEKQSLIQSLYGISSTMITPEILYADDFNVSSIIGESELGDLVVTHDITNDCYEIRCDLESQVQDPDNWTYRVISKETYIDLLSLS